MTLRSTSRLALAAVLLGLTGWTFATNGWHVATERYTFASGSHVWVEGTSTVHDWSCDADRLTATLDGTASGASLTAISALTVTAPVAGMDCDNGTMDGKLRAALGSSPIRFTLTNARVGTTTTGQFLVEADGQLSIHGTTRTQRVRANGRALSGSRFQFTGEVPVAMSDFGVDPPRAMAGLLHTGDRVTVKFDVTAAR